MCAFTSYKPEGLPMNSTPFALNKASMRKYDDLEVPCDKILGGYVWIDGTGINLRSKDRTFDFIPKSVKDLPIWYFDGSNTAQANPDNSDTFIFPEVIYHDPFRRGSHILVLADTYLYNYQPTRLPMNSTPFALNKASMRKYDDLEVPCDKILGGYVWIDGTGINLRSKDRTFDFIPKSVKDLPIWYFDGSNTAQANPDNSDTFIFPEVIYHDPFRRGSHILVLADTYLYNYQPTPTNFRKACVTQCEKGEVEEPWFGFNQEFFLTTTDGRPLGWPAGGFPAPPGPYYCATGANKIVARDLMEALYRCCLYAGVNINGIYPGTTPAQWNFQVGPSPGIRAADDLWMARYILARLAEEYGTVVTFDPQPVADWPGNGTFCYFSSKDMREDDGILVIERAIDKLSRRHGVHINEYDASNGADNARRLTGKNGMPHIRDFTAGVANRCCSVRIPRQVSEDKKGYLEDRRPAANADPYRIVSILLRTCIFDE